MEYSQGEYGQEVKQVKKKNYKIPIITVLVVAVIAVIVIAYLMNSMTTLTFTGDDPSAGNLYGYEQQIVQNFDIDSEDITLYKQSGITVENGKITDMELELAIKYGNSKEYWRASDKSGGIKIKYKKTMDADTETCYTFASLCGFLSAADGLLSADGISGYTAGFSTDETAYGQSGGNYIWNGSSFSTSAAADTVCYMVTISADSGEEYIFCIEK